MNCSREKFRELPPSFRTVGRPSVKSYTLSVRSGEFHSTSVNFPTNQKTSFNFPCGRGTFRQLPQCPLRTEDLSSTFVKFSSGREIFHQHSSTFLAAGRASVNFCQLSMQSGKCISIYINFPFARETSVNFRQFPYGQKTVCEFCQPSMKPGDLP